MPMNAPSSIRDVTLVQTTQEVIHILGNLPEAILLEVMERKSREQDVLWFNAMIQGGIFDQQHDLPWIRPNGSMTMSGLCADFTQRAVALSTFTLEVGWKEMPSDAALGVPESDALIAVFEPVPGFKTAFLQGVKALIETHRALVNDSHAGESAAQDRGVWRAMASWLAAACVIDSPEAVREIALACPQAMQFTFDVGTIGGAIKECFVKDEYAYAPSDAGNEADDPFQVNALFVALSLSRIDCMKTLLHAGSPIALGDVSEGDDTSPVYVQTLHTVMRPACTPRAFAALITLALEQGGTAPLNIEKRAGEAMSEEFQWMRPYIPAYASTAVYDSRPADSVRLAVRNGYAFLLERLEAVIPWQRIIFHGASSPVLEACEASASPTAAPKSESSQAICKLLDLASRDGHEDAFATYGVSRTSGPNTLRVLEPVTSLAIGGFIEPLKRYIDAGFDIKAESSGRSYIDTLEELAPDMAPVLRSYTAAKRAQEALADMDLRPSLPSP